MRCFDLMVILYFFAPLLLLQTASMPGVLELPGKPCHCPRTKVLVSGKTLSCACNRIYLH